MSKVKEKGIWAKIFKSLNGTKDMTDGKPMKLILEFGLPLLFGLIFQQMYNMVDSIIVGKKLGVDALAAVGSTGSINFMILGFCIGVCNGFAIPVAQTFGAKDFSNLKKYIANGAFAAVVFAAVMTVTVGIFTRQILIAPGNAGTIPDIAELQCHILTFPKPPESNRKQVHASSFTKKT